MSEPAKTADTRDIRIINLNENQPIEYVTNSIKTAKYNM
jgi:hypothetical protein